MNKKIVKSSVKSVKISSQKLLKISSSIKSLKPVYALQLLRHSKLNAARIFEKVVASAVSNAENNSSIDSADLVISSIVIGRAPYLRRFTARGRGKSNIIKKHYSNIYIELSQATL
jgi:large subunit ribosomal protein L22